MRLVRLLALCALALPLFASPRDGYVFRMGGNQTISGSLEDFGRVSRQLGNGPYLWVERGEKQFVITERALLAEVWSYFAPQRELRPKQHEIAEAIRKSERESDALDDARDDRKLTSAEEARLDELHAQERQLSRREQELDEREEALDRVAEKKMWQLVDDAIRSGAARPGR
jgi:hypothetical protein